MITKAQVKHIRSLADKKNRIEFNQFVVEGDKMVCELLNSGSVILKVYSTIEWALLNLKDNSNNFESYIVSVDELKALSLMTTPNQVIAIAELPSCNQPEHMGVSIVLEIWAV